MPTNKADALAASIGARILEHRVRAKLTQTEFAEQLGLSKPYLSQIESGKRLPSLAMLLGIAEKLDVQARELL